VLFDRSVVSRELSAKISELGKIVDAVCAPITAVVISGADQPLLNIVGAG